MMEYIYIICALISTNTLILSTSAQDPGKPANSSGSKSDAEKFDEYKNNVCLLNPPFRGEPEFGYLWMEEMSSDEVLELAFVNMAYQLSSDAIVFRSEELGWRKPIINLLALITKATCTDDIVSEQFLNSAKSLFLHYLRKYDNYLGNRTVENEELEQLKKQEWDEIMESLQECAAVVTPIQMAVECETATNYFAKDGNVYPIHEETEQFDVNARSSHVDWVIETMWWMFSTTYARCYAFFYPNEDIILLFFELFREDFLDYFAVRWGSVGPNAIHFPMIFGPYDSTSSAINMRKCAAASFQYEELGNRQLVRPVTVIVDGSPMRNFKVGTGGVIEPFA